MFIKLKALYQISVLGMIPLVWMLVGENMFNQSTWLDNVFGQLSPLAYLVLLIYAFVVYYSIPCEEDRKELSIPGYLILSVFGIFFMMLSIARVCWGIWSFIILKTPLNFVMVTGLAISFLALIQTLSLMSFIIYKVRYMKMEKFPQNYLSKFFQVVLYFILGALFFSWCSLQLPQSYLIFSNVFKSFMKTHWWILLWFLMWLKGNNEKGKIIQNSYFEWMFCSLIIGVMIPHQLVLADNFLYRMFSTIVFSVIFSFICLKFFQSDFGKKISKNYYMASDQCRQVVFIATLIGGTLSVFIGIVPSFYVICYLNFIMIPYLDKTFGPFPRISFNSVIWKNSAKEVRRAMIRDLIREFPHKNVARQRVADLLGKPDLTGLSVWFYEIGGCFLEKHFLQVRFDNDKIIEMKVVEI